VVKGRKKGIPLPEGKFISEEGEVPVQGGRTKVLSYSLGGEISTGYKSRGICKGKKEEELAPKRQGE